MPHLRIYGIPPSGTEGILSNMTDRLETTLVDMSILGIERENIFIFYPADLRRINFKEIVCDAVLFDALERTPEVRKEFAERITKIIQNCFPGSIVKCMSFTFDRELLGYSTRDPKN